MFRSGENREEEGVAGWKRKLSTLEALTFRAWPITFLWNTMKELSIFAFVPPFSQIVCWRCVYIYNRSRMLDLAK